MNDEINKQLEKCKKEFKEGGQFYNMTLIDAYGYGFEDAIDYLENNAHNEVFNGDYSVGEFLDFKVLYNAAFFNLLYREGKYTVIKSKKHNNILYENEYFIVQAELPTGQISDYYQNEYWSLFCIPELKEPNESDGHTVYDIFVRLDDYIMEEFHSPKQEIIDTFTNSGYKYINDKLILYTIDYKNAVVEIIIEDNEILLFTVNLYENNEIIAKLLIESWHEFDQFCDKYRIPKLKYN